MKEDGALKGSLRVDGALAGLLEGGRRPKGLLKGGRRPKGLLGGGRRPKGLLEGGRRPEGLLEGGRSSKLLLEEPAFGQKEAGFGQKSRLFWPERSRLWPEKPASLAKSRLPGQRSRLLAEEAGSFGRKPASSAKAGLRRLTPAYTYVGTCKSRLTPAYAGFAFPWPEEAGLRRLPPAPSVAPKEAGVSRLLPGQRSRILAKRSRLRPEKEPAFGQKSRLLFRWAPRGRSRRKPANAGSFFGQKSRLLLARSRLFFWPAFGRLLPASFRGAQRRRVRHCGEAPKAPLLVPARCRFRPPSGGLGRKRGKHSYGAQRKRRSRRKPAFTVFSWW